MIRSRKKHIITSLFIFLLLCSQAICERSLKNITSKSRLTIFFIVDGLRPDLINEVDTPNIFRLSKEGVFFERSHAVFPTVTRVNAAAIATGAYPSKNGIVSNSMYVPLLNPDISSPTDNYQILNKLDELTKGKLLLCKTWAERLAEHDLLPVAISSGSTGSAFLLNHKSLKGVGVLINPIFEMDSIVAFPEMVNKQILKKFIHPSSLKLTPNYNTKVNWSIQVLTDYVLPELHPDVIYCWITEPDHTQHEYGIGAPQTVETIRNSDRNIGLVIQKMKQLGIFEETNILLVSDHGFSTFNYGINVEEELINAKLKISANSDDVVLASSGESVLVHVKDRNKEKIQSIVRFLQSKDWIGVIFTKDLNSTPFQSNGWVEGTFSLGLIHMPIQGRGPDIVLTFPWSSKVNKFGFPGEDYTNTRDAIGSRNGIAAGHGSMSPWTIRNTMIAWGVDFKSGIRSTIPACSIDFTATILALKNVPIDDDIQGRVLDEVLVEGSDIEKIPVEVSVYKSKYQNKNFFIQISKVGKHWYVDKSWVIGE